jgi:hypothetical protein
MKRRLFPNSGIHLFPRQIDRMSAAAPNQRETDPSRLEIVALSSKVFFERLGDKLFQPHPTQRTDRQGCKRAVNLRRKEAPIYHRGKAGRFTYFSVRCRQGLLGRHDQCGLPWRRNYRCRKLARTSPYRLGHQQLTEAFKLVRIEDKCTSKTDDSGAFACHKLKEFATRGVKRQLTTQLGFITGIPIREQRTSLIVDILQDQISGR